MEDESDKSQSEFDDSMGVSSKLTETDQVKREPSPELARISALITRPPKQKSSSKREFGFVFFFFYSVPVLKTSFILSYRANNRFWFNVECSKRIFG